jgi:hypothetical protein
MVDVADSYILTIADLETRLASDPRPSAIALLAASDAIQTWYLQKATAIIDSLYLKGSTYYPIDQLNPPTGYQARQFPRVINGRVYNWDYTGNAELVPEEVKKACLEEALALYDAYVSSPGDQKRRKLQEQGVTSFSLGKLSETYAPGAARKWKGLHSQEAYDFMKQYIAGAVRPVP